MKKITIMRVVTASYCVEFHMAYTLRKLQEDFNVVVVGSHVSKYQKQYPNITWVDLDIERKPHIYKDIVAVFQLYKIIKKYQPSITHSIMSKAGLITAIASWLARVPVRMHTFTGQIWATKNGLIKVLLTFLDRIVNSLNTVCLTDSPSQSNLLFENGFKYQGKPLPIVLKGSLSGVDLERFNFNKREGNVKKLKKDLGLTKEFVFCFLARKTQDKGAIDILMAFNQIVQKFSNIKLLFVGPDESEGRVESCFLGYPLLDSHVIRVDRAVSNHEDYLSLSQVLCLPSYREGFGSIVIDAAALGVPSIGSKIMGLVDAIEDQRSGILFPCGDIDKLAQEMCFCIANKGYVKELGENARNRVEKYFDANVIYQEQKRLYQKLIDNA